MVSNSTNCEMSFTGKGCSRIAFTTVKLAVFAPIPSASDNTATALKPGLLRTKRRHCRKSCQRGSKCPLRLPLKHYQPDPRASPEPLPTLTQPLLLAHRPPPAP